MAKPGSYPKQESDQAQKGPGVAVRKYMPTAPSAPGIGPAGNSTSGTSQGHKRGSQGQ